MISQFTLQSEVQKRVDLQDQFEGETQKLFQLLVGDPSSPEGKARSTRITEYMESLGDDEEVGFQDVIDLVYPYEGSMGGERARVRAEALQVLHAIEQLDARIERFNEQIPITYQNVLVEMTQMPLQVMQGMADDPEAIAAFVQSLENATKGVIDLAFEEEDEDENEQPPELPPAA